MCHDDGSKKLNDIICGKKCLFFAAEKMVILCVNSTFDVHTCFVIHDTDDVMYIPS